MVTTRAAVSPMMPQHRASRGRVPVEGGADQAPVLGVMAPVVQVPYRQGGARTNGGTAPPHRPGRPPRPGATGYGSCRVARREKGLPFDQVADAHRYLESGSQLGKVVNI